MNDQAEKISESIRAPTSTTNDILATLDTQMDNSRLNSHQTKSPI